MDVKEFLQRDDIQQSLSQDNLAEVYGHWEGRANILSRFLVENGIAPLEYMNEVVPYMFAGLDLKHIVIPEGIKNIGKCAFEKCFGLTNVTIPDGVTSIGKYAFELCTGLTSVVIPNSVTGISDHAFRDCINLTSINIPDNVKRIGDGAFVRCQSLTSITIPEDIAKIEPCTFNGCVSMREITIKGQYTKLPEDSFFTSDNVKIRCYEGSAAHVFVTHLDLYHELI